MLGNPLYDRGVFFQQFFIPLLGGVLYAGKEEPLINMEAFDDFSSYICRSAGFCPRFLKKSSRFITDSSAGSMLSREKGSVSVDTGCRMTRRNPLRKRTGK